MTDHQKLMLRRHLEAAARHYERRATELRVPDAVFTGESPSCATVASGYDALAADARRLKEMLR